MRPTARERHGEPHVADADSGVLLEEIVTGSTEGWFTESSWGDRVSVEGIVAGGVHRPLCITGRLPTVHPFAARSGVTPVPSAQEALRRIENAVKAADEALRLDTCATRTEVGLGADGQLWVIGTAARFGGMPIARQAEEVYGLDMIGMLVRQLLGEPVEYPSRMLAEGQGAAASLVVRPVDSVTGQPWDREAPWDFEAVGWTSLLSPSGAMEVALEQSHDDSVPVPPRTMEQGGPLTCRRMFVSGADASTVVETA